MKVNSSVEKNGNVSNTSKTEAASGVKERKRSPRGDVATDSRVADKVEISKKGKEAAQAKKAALAASDVDEAKVARLRAQIQNGNYKVDADKVADRLVDDHLSYGF